MTRDRSLLGWYRSRDRDIPWRDDTDPYRVLVGEVMAQQTQATRAAGHFRRFVSTFPTVESLGAASLADVLEQWAGLGYNSRAKRLRDAARIIEQHSWPDDLTSLPGVGPYTAAAVRCFAFGEQVAVVDTNVRRVVSRWRGTEVGDNEVGDEVGTPAADWNQAMMDLGAEICRARSPRCDVCPVIEWCSGPDTFQPPRRQSPYVGSVRQARSQALFHLGRHGPATASELHAATGIEETRLRAALIGLVDDGMVTPAADSYAVSD